MQALRPAALPREQRVSGPALVHEDPPERDRQPGYGAASTAHRCDFRISVLERTQGVREIVRFEYHTRNERKGGRCDPERPMEHIGIHEVERAALRVDTPHCALPDAAQARVA